MLTFDVSVVLPISTKPSWSVVDHQSVDPDSVEALAFTAFCGVKLRWLHGGISCIVLATSSSSQHSMARGQFEVLFVSMIK